MKILSTVVTEMRRPNAIVLPKPKFCLAYQTYQVLKLIF